jgi:hypothetical protein
MSVLVDGKLVEKACRDLAALKGRQSESGERTVPFVINWGINKKSHGSAQP